MIVIRHARAGDRAGWVGDDRLRPLDKKGRKHTERLVEELAGHEIERILSSPYDRCVQTVKPLARARGVEIELREELGEGRQSSEGVQLAGSLADQPVAICVHGGLSESLVGKHLKKGEWLDVQKV
jgi:phosphohistidine phosphatase SixA